MEDETGNWPKWVKNIAKKVVKAIKKVVSSVWKSIEAEIGVGVGVGGSISKNATAEFSRDTFIGLDDGELVTGNTVTSEVSLFDSKISTGETYRHVTEKGGKRINIAGTPYDSPLDMIHYPGVEKGNQVTFLLLSINESDEILISISASVHIGAGGHFSVEFNISEFLERIFEE